MGTEVLRPQDYIRESPAIFNHRKSYHHGVPKVNRKPVKPEIRRKSPEPKKSASYSAADDDLRSRNSKIVLGEVTILRRGESLDTKAKASEKKEISKEIKVYGKGRLGPDPKKVRFGLQDTYAGSAFFTSPAPSSLPLPSFFMKDCAVKEVDDWVATRDLRRLLRLD